MSLSFQPVSTETAPRPWRELVSTTRLEVIHLASVGLQAVMHALVLPADTPVRRNFNRTNLLVPFQEDRRYLDLNPELQNRDLDSNESHWLGDGIAALVLARGVSTMLEDFATFNVDRQDGQGSVFKRLVVPDEGDKREACARKIGEKTGLVTEFTISWKPEAVGVLVKKIEVGALIEGGNMDSRTVVAGVSTVPRGFIITTEGGGTVERVSRLQEVSPNRIRDMGQSLLIATSSRLSA